MERLCEQNCKAQTYVLQQSKLCLLCFKAELVYSSVPPAFLRKQESSHWKGCVNKTVKLKHTFCNRANFVCSASKPNSFTALFPQPFYVCTLPLRKQESSHWKGCVNKTVKLRHAFCNRANFVCSVSNPNSFTALSPQPFHVLHLKFELV